MTKNTCSVCRYPLYSGFAFGASICHTTQYHAGPSENSIVVAEKPPWPQG
ncbi:hypothetical protein H6S20_12900 [Escherichia coli]|nr:hypothetical protein H6S20_12900 [Escherichia coli]